MKILILSEYFPTGKSLKFSGGVEARNLYIAKYLSKKHQITIITSRIRGTKPKEKIFNANIIRVGKTRNYEATAGGIFSRLSYIKEALEASYSQDFDIIEGTNYITHFIAKRVGTKLKKPYTYWYPDVWINQWFKNTGAIGLLGEILERYSINGPKNYIAISQFTADKLKKYISDNKRVQIIPCGIDKQEFKNTVEQQKQIICISRLAKYKNIKILILAFALLKKEVKGFKLIIIGQGPEENNLKSLIKNLKLAKNVIIYKNIKRTKLVNLLKESTVFCLPSSVEGFGISVIEAVVSGVPYVISNIQVFKEITYKGRGGLLFKLNDIYDLKNKLSKIINDEKLRNKKKNELQNLSKLYDWQKISMQTEKFYQTSIKSCA